MDIKNARRKTFDVEFVEVTKDNVEEVAEWCGGTGVLNPDGSTHIQLVAPPTVQNNRQTKAYIGDFVLKSPTGFKSFPPKAFHNTFTEILRIGETGFVAEEDAPVASPTRVKASDLGKPAEPTNLKEAMDRDAAE